MNNILIYYQYYY